MPGFFIGLGSLLAAFKFDDAVVDMVYVEVRW